MEYLWLETTKREQYWERDFKKKNTEIFLAEHKSTEMEHRRRENFETCFGIPCMRNIIWRFTLNINFSIKENHHEIFVLFISFCFHFCVCGFFFLFRENINMFSNVSFTTYTMCEFLALQKKMAFILQSLIEYIYGSKFNWHI